ncbi:MAG: hypothetical protein JSV16_13320 [Candidatus Hydrogenedentota bacterium]|nr:MAG: hypothetical protein JSV16_13320 [Candidatus Hydrogenedentota bacterium]
MRQVLLTAGFGDPLSQEDRSWIRGRGFAGVRSDYGPGVLAALYATPLRTLVIACDRERPHEFVVDRVVAICREMRNLGYLHHRPGPIPAIEPMNEPDLDPYWKTRPRELADAIWECWRIAQAFSRGIMVVTPGISNLHQKGLAYLEAMVSAGIPDDVVVGFHRYPAKSDPTAAHDGFKDRWAEVRRLLALAGSRKLWCTETGWSSGPLEKPRRVPFCWFTKKVWLSEEQVADFASTELRFWARVPEVESLTWYQINSGPNRNDPEDNFGLRTYPDRANTILARWMPELIKEVTSCDN